MVQALGATAVQGWSGTELLEVQQCSWSDPEGRSWLGARRSYEALPEKTTVAAELESGAEALS